ncbi:DUF6479 family protein [Streptomyces bikiniensis]|uniref:DUF6479 family protein n=1 Tax=Streptomyces bikiniensis TaxID=1896 RepID=UPI0006892B98|nr:DUF6479 family protein [Streptomyces bikiniensis]
MSVCASGSAPFTNAAAVWQTGLAQASVGLVVVAVIIGAFLLGARIRDEELPPPDPASQPRRPATDRRPGRTSEYRHPVRAPFADATRRLRPHQLLGGRTETSPEPPAEERRKW